MDCLIFEMLEIVCTGEITLGQWMEGNSCAVSRMELWAQCIGAVFLHVGSWDEMVWWCLQSIGKTGMELVRMGRYEGLTGRHLQGHS